MSFVEIDHVSLFPASLSPNSTDSLSRNKLVARESLTVDNKKDGVIHPTDGSITVSSRTDDVTRALKLLVPITNRSPSIA